VFAAVALVVLAASALTTADARAGAAPPECRPGGPPVELSGSLTAADVGRYRELPIAVTAGTTRLEVGYSWTSAGPESATDQTVVDLGLWDQRGTAEPAGFRGWSGSRQGKVAEGQPPIFVQADRAERGYVPGPIEPGTWSVELGFGAVQSAGATWSVNVRCLDVATGPAWTPDPVDPSYVARDQPGWYRADLHLHAYHSNPRGPDPTAMIEFARKAKLDVVPVTEYVTDTHWGQLGAAQRANPDLLLWPGREVITYLGHVIVLGETPSTLDYRQGFDGVDLIDIERKAVGDGAVFQIAHPTIFPGEALQAFCRGCEFRLGAHVDWDLVDTLEVVTGPVVVDVATQSRPEPGADGIANPFVPTAIALWESLLQQGHRITGVSGSDDKLGPSYGETATMIKADRLSRPALVDALRAAHAYVQTKGADASPTYELVARTPDGATGTFGDTLVATTATMEVTVRAATGQQLVVSRNGSEVQRIAVTGDPFTTTIAAARAADEGPLGTFWRVDVADALSFTAIGNPVFLADAPPFPKIRGAVPTSPPVIPNFPAAAAAAAAPADPSPRSGSGGGSATALIGVAVTVLLAGLAAAIVLRRRRADA
jgi:hypothetical protein